jgi:hypothetical protein
MVHTDRQGSPEDQRHVRLVFLQYQGRQFRKVVQKPRKAAPRKRGAGWGRRDNVWLLVGDKARGRGNVVREEITNSLAGRGEAPGACPIISLANMLCRKP